VASLTDYGLRDGLKRLVRDLLEPAVREPFGLETSWLIYNEARIECARAIARLLDDSAWQPIDSAPRDGRLLIGALIRDGEVWRVHEMRHNGLAFYSRTGSSLPEMTHWMPMPPAEAPRG
jgi:hypothetical protein